MYINTYRKYVLQLGSKSHEKKFRNETLREKSPDLRAIDLVL